METLPSLHTIQVESLISQALDKGVPVETLERLLAMAKDIKAEHAKEQFDRAMAGFQAECPIIKKTKPVTTKSGVVAYRYAPIDSIISQVKHLLEKYGFSYAIDTVTNESSVQATCIVKHNAGHSEQRSYAVPLGERTNVMSASQVVAAALTFASRYAFCNVFGIMTGNQDTDAVKQQIQPINEDQLEQIKELIVQTTFTEQQLLKGYHVDIAEKLTYDQAEEFIERLQAYINRMKHKDE